MDPVTLSPKRAESRPAKSTSLRMRIELQTIPGRGVAARTVRFRLGPIAVEAPARVCGASIDPAPFWTFGYGREYSRGFWGFRARRDVRGPPGRGACRNLRAAGMCGACRDAGPPGHAGLPGRGACRGLRGARREAGPAGMCGACRDAGPPGHAGLPGRGACRDLRGARRDAGPAGTCSAAAVSINRQGHDGPVGIQGIYLPRYPHSAQPQRCLNRNQSRTSPVGVEGAKTG
jgi:syndecan 1